MSYDIELRGGPCAGCVAAGTVPDLPDPTYNLTPIFHLALIGEQMPNPEVSEGAAVVLGARVDGPRGLRVLSGRRASETTDQIERAIFRLRDEAWSGRFAELAPKNGWGTVAGATRVLEELLTAAVDHPNHVWEVR
jgi:hypothetical protein